ncbi:MAG: hypothetical protein KGY80_14470 [Candidatus Thorarchaeota archaeon]|nr:hypothetical protein [Candidatus Thorarchaeota archaeon]
MEGKYRKFLSENGMLLLAFVCPFMLYIPLPLEHDGFSVFSAILIIHFYSGYVQIAPLYYPLFNFFMWVPYVYIGYEFRKLITGQMEDPKGFREKILIATVIGILAVILPPLLAGSLISDGLNLIILPLPVVPLVAIIQSRRYLSRMKDEPW